METWIGERMCRSRSQKYNAMKKHVYLFNESSRASNCGIGTYVKQLIECFKGVESISLNIISLKTSKEFTISNFDSFSVIHTPVINNINKNEDYRLYYRNVAYLIAEHIKIPVTDKLIFHFNTPVSNIMVILKKMFPESLIIYTIHVDQMCLANKGNILLVKEKMMNHHNNIIHPDDDKIVFESVDHLICLSKFMRDLLLNDYKIPENKISLIYNGIKDEGYFLSKNKKRELRKRMFIPYDEKIVLFVGRLHHIKGVEELIEAFKKVVYKIPKSKLIIVGEGDFMTYYKICEGFWNKIIFTGLIDKDYLYDFYRIADVGVMSSFYEQCSFVAIEMMMFGLPIIGTTAPGLDEMIENTFDKVNICYNDSNAILSSDHLAELIILKLKNKIEVSNYRDVYIQKYSLADMFYKTKKVYDLQDNNLLNVI